MKAVVDSIEPQANGDTHVAVILRADDAVTGEDGKIPSIGRANFTFDKGTASPIPLTVGAVASLAFG